MFCAQCGARLRESPPQAPALRDGHSPSAVSGFRISVPSAALSLFVASLAVGSLLRFLGIWGFDGVEIPLISLAALLGSLAGLAVTRRLQRIGRLQSVVGMTLMGVGLAVIGSEVDQYSWYEEWGWLALGMALAGVGIGVAHPLHFWRSLGRVSRPGKLLLVVAGIGGLLLALASDGVPLGAAVAFLIGVPLVLFLPIVRGSVDRDAG